MILLLTLLYVFGYLNTVALYYSIPEKHRSKKLDNLWPIVAVFFWWAVSLYVLYLLFVR